MISAIILWSCQTHQSPSLHSQFRSRCAQRLQTRVSDGGQAEVRGWCVPADKQRRGECLRVCSRCVDHVKCVLWRVCVCVRWWALRSCVKCWRCQRWSCRWRSPALAVRSQRCTPSCPLPPATARGVCEPNTTHRIEREDVSPNISVLTLKFYG